MKAKGLIAAGGEATRLGELTRVVNKHLLPVGGWPMIYYPLQLLQLGGRARGDDRHRAGPRRPADRPARKRADEQPRGSTSRCSTLDLTYKVQVEPGGIAQVVGMAESFAGDDDLVVCLGDNIFEYAEAEAIRAFVDGDDGAAVFVKEVPGPGALRRRRLRRGRRVSDVVEKAGVVDLRYPSPPSSDAVVGLYCYSPDVFEVIRGLEAVLARRARDHRRQPALRRARHARVPPRHGWWEDAGTQESLPEIGALIAPHRRQQGRVVIDGLLRIPLQRFEDERGWFIELRRESAAAEADPPDERLVLAPRRDPRPPLPRARPGRPLRLPAGDGARRRARPRDRRGVHRGHRRRQPGRDLRSRPPRPRLRGAHRSPLLLPRDRGVRPGRSRRAGRLLGRPAREAPVEHASRRSSRRATWQRVS